LKNASVIIPTAPRVFAARLMREIAMDRIGLNEGGHLTPLNATEPVSDPLLERIRGEFNEMPGLRLTLSQAQRLWGLDACVCQASLRRLVDARFLTVNGGLYSRSADGAATRYQPRRMLRRGLTSIQRA
jgi:hypothetical protein